MILDRAVKKFLCFVDLVFSAKRNGANFLNLPLGVPMSRTDSVVGDVVEIKCICQYIFCCFKQEVA